MAITSLAQRPRGEYHVQPSRRSSFKTYMSQAALGFQGQRRYCAVEIYRSLLQATWPE